MGKKRIHELAKELSLTSAELIQKISEWKLSPGIKLVASSGLEDYLVEDVLRRLRAPAGEAGVSAQTVVRRRKKSEAAETREAEPEFASAGPADESAAAPPLNQERPEMPRPEVPVLKAAVPEVPVVGVAVSEAPVPEAPVPKIPVPEIPVPEIPVPEAREVTEVTVPGASVPGAPVPEIPVPEAREVMEVTVPGAPVPGAPASVRQARGEASRPAAPPARKITRELNEAPARSPLSSKPGFEQARVVGSRPNWKDAPGSRPAPFGRRPPETSSWPKTEARPAPSRPGPPRPGADPRRPPAAVQPPVSDSESLRRRDNKKKKSHGGAPGRHESEETQNAKAARRRDVVERTDLYSEGDWERVRRRGKVVKKPKAKTEITVPKAIKRRIKVDEAITVSELAHRLSIKASDIIKKLMGMGVMAGLNQALDFDTAALVAAEFGYEVEKSAFDEENYLQMEYSQASPNAARPPVVTIMGHVDHGKTSLLDYIRKTNIQSGEAGGITQHIGAYHVRAGGRYITFLDTPGHEAFTAMRSRGAQVTDIVVLIVAADDGLMPQTREAADHAKAAGVPIVVAINKIDKPGSDPEKTRREMTEIGLIPEAWGGETVFVEISAKTGQGVGELLDMILLQADILELKSRPDGPARGRIIEARLDKGRGPVATVLIQEGLLKQGDAYVCGVFHGRIRAMLDDQGGRIAEAAPAIPVEIQGLSGVPQAGDEFIVLADEKQARQVSQHRLLRQREAELTKSSRLTLENLFDNIKAGEIKGLNLIVKTDVQGSLEAITDALSKLSTPEMKINVIHQSTGAVSETDVMLASASNALVICFGVRPPTKAQELAEAEHIQVRYYDVIYQLIDDIKEAMAGLLDPVRSEKTLGRADVRKTFAVSRVGTIAGSYVLDGKMLRGARARLLRDGVVVHDGRLASLKRMKDDAREVLSGYECGIGFESYNDIKIGDQIEAYQIEETAATVALINEAVARAAQRRVKEAEEEA